MEDIERDTQKSLKDTAFTKPKKRSKNWTLLFVGDQGKVIRVRNFRLLITVWLSITIITTAAAVVFLLLYQDQSKNMVSLTQGLTDAQMKAKSLRDEKDILMARLVLAESKITSSPPKSAQKKIKKTSKPVKETITLPTPETTQPVKAEEIKPAADPVKQVSSQEPIQDTIIQESDDDEPLEPVDIDDFFALVEEDSNTLRVKYKIRNVSQRSKLVSGRTFMILKGNEEDYMSWLIFPETLMESGKPLEISNGRSFSITRFKTIRFKAPYLNGGKPFSTATILVYSTDGELLLEKNYSIQKGREGSVLTN